MHEAVTRHLLLPVHERLRGRDTHAVYRRLRRNDRSSPAALESLRLAKLRALLRHCLERVPLQRERLHAAGVRQPEDVDLSSLAALPPMERSDVREHLAGLCTDGTTRGLLRYSTGGSTGAPLVFCTDQRKESCHNAQKLRYRAWYGVRPGDRQVDFWGSPIELDNQSRLRLFKDRWLLNHRLLSAFDLSTERLDAYARELLDYRPRLIYGYPTVIYRMAAHIRDRGLQLGDWRPRLVACTAEMLLEHQRQTIAEVFAAPVANEYGSRDAGLVAHECPEGRLHLAAEHVLVEADRLDDEGVGDLLITNLDAYGMPLLRYRVGDRARLQGEACSCTLPLPVLGGLAGRTNDFLVGRSGKLIHSLAPIYVLREYATLRQFRLHQAADLSLTVTLVSREPLPAAELDSIRARLQGILDLAVEVRFEFPEAIAPERSGKYRWVISEAADAS